MRSWINLAISIIYLFFVKQSFGINFHTYTNLLEPTSTSTNQISFSHKQWHQIIKKEPTSSEYQPLKTKPGELLKFQLPLDTQLNVSGRKSILAKFGAGRYIGNPQKVAPPGITEGFNLHQETFIKVQGNIQQKVKVELDYSDIAGQEKRNVLIHYDAPKGKYLENVTFGDVQLSLPQSRFLRYSKNLFGAKVNLNLKEKVKMQTVWSKAQGNKQTEQFKGDAKITAQQFWDTSYIKNRYFQLPQKNIKPDSLYVYIYNPTIKHPDQNLSYTHITAYSYSYFVGTPNTSTSCTSEYFVLQEPVKDYVFHQQDSMIVFMRSLADSDLVAVAYKYDSGSFGYAGDLVKFDKFLLIKDDKTKPGYWSFYHQLYADFEKNNYYPLSKNKPTSIKILDQHDRDFHDANKNQKYDTGEYFYIRIFGLDRDGNGVVDDDCIDRDLKVLRFPNKTPFDLTDTTLEKSRILALFGTETLCETLSNFKCYPPPTEPFPLYKIKIEYAEMVTFYTLAQPFIIEGSENVYVNGRLCQRGVDYYISYVGGYIEFLKPLPAGSTIDVEYEYKPIIGGYRQTVLGSHVSFNPIESLTLKGAYLYQGEPAPMSVPSVTNMVDLAQLVNVQASANLTKLIQQTTNINLPVNIQAEFEGARSMYTPNRFGYALIDNMEGAKRKRIISLSEDSWQIAPLELNMQRAELLYKDKPYSERCGPYDKREDAIEDISQENVLTLKMNNLSGTNSWVAIVSCINREAEDFSMEKYLNLWVSRNWSDVASNIFIDLGHIKEDADGDGTLDTEDINGDGLLNRGEDLGWDFGGISRPGKDNNKLDSEDLDLDGKLDSVHCYFEFKITPQDVKIDNNKGFVLYTLPLHAAKAIGQADWHSIKAVRLRIQGKEGINSGQIKIAKISLVHPAWQHRIPDKVPGTFNVSFKNSYDDPKYLPLSRSNYKDYFKKLYPDYKEHGEESAMVIEYQFSTKTNVTIYEIYRKERTFLNHKYLRAFIWKVDNASATVSIKFGVDVNNYFYLPVNLSELPSNQWQLVELELTDQAKMQKYKVGSPDITKIKMIGISAKGGAYTGRQEFWVNEVHLAEALTQYANAQYFKLSSTLADKISVSYETERTAAGFTPTPQPTAFNSVDKNRHQISSCVKLPLASIPINYTYTFNKTTESLPKNKYLSMYYQGDLGVERKHIHTFHTHIKMLKGSLKIAPQLSHVYTNHHYQKNYFLRRENVLTISNAYSKKFDKKIFFMPIGEQFTIEKLSYTPQVKQIDTLYPKMDKPNENTLNLLQTLTADSRWIINSKLSCSPFLEFKAESQKVKHGTISDNALIPKSMELKVAANNLVPIFTKTMLLNMFDWRLDPHMNLAKTYHKPGIGIPPLTKNVSSAVKFPLNATFKIPTKYKKVLRSASFRFDLELEANYNNLPANWSYIKLWSMFYKDYYRGKLFNRKISNNCLIDRRTRASDVRKYVINSSWFLFNKVDATCEYTLSKKVTEEQKVKHFTDSHSITNVLTTNLINVLPEKYRKKVLPGSSIKHTTTLKRTADITPHAKSITDELTLYPTIIYKIPTTKENLEKSLEANYKSNYKWQKGKVSTFERIKEKSIAYTIKYKLTKGKYIPIDLIRRKIDLGYHLTLQTSLQAKVDYHRYNNQIKSHKNIFTSTINANQRMGENTTSNFGIKFIYSRNHLEKGKDYFGAEGSINVTFNF